MSDITIRALIQIDNLQPKFAAYNGATVQGSVPLSGDTVLIGEFAPGNGVFTLIDRALKASSVEATSQLVEREFGFFMLRSPSNAEVRAARDSILSELGASMEDRVKPKVATTQIITSVEPYQAQLLNKWRKGALLVPGQTLGIIECAPAAYISIAANEAEKAADIDIVEVRAVGRFGRLFISGSENSVQTGMEAATTAIEAVDGKVV